MAATARAATKDTAVEETPTATLPAPEPATLTWEAIQSRAEASVATDTVFVPEWGGNVTLRGLYVNEARDIWDRSHKDGEEGDGATVACYTLAYGCLSPRIPVEEAERLGQQGAGVIFRLFYAIDRLTDVSEEAQKRVAERFRDT